MKRRVGNEILDIDILYVPRYQSIGIPSGENRPID